MLNAYDYGGYLDLQRDQSVFIDGRNRSVSRPNFWKTTTGWMQGDTRRHRRNTGASRYHVAWTIFPAGSPTVKTLDQLPDWHRLYADANAVVHVKD